jgi:hypothetical protein
MTVAKRNAEWLIGVLDGRNSHALYVRRYARACQNPVELRHVTGAPGRGTNPLRQRLHGFIRG